MIQTASLSEQVEQALKSEILAGNFEPGQRIDIEELAENWGVSITPVRDAVKQLEKVGLVKVLSRRGVYVTTIDWPTFENLFEVRIALECMAIRKASRRIPDDEIAGALVNYEEAERRFAETGDHEFLVEHDHRLHDLVVDYCDNERLIEIMQDLHDLSALARAALIINRPDSYERALPEHLAVMRALSRRDADAAEAAMHSHLTNVLERARTTWDQQVIENDNE